MTAIAASTTAALIAGGPATVATALTVQYAASGSAVAVMAAGRSTAMAAAGGAAALVNGAVTGAAGAATSLASLAGAAGFGAGAAAGGDTSVTGIAAGFFSSLVSGAATGAVAAVQTAAASAGGLTGVASASFFAGPIGLAVVGDDGVSWDFWKPVVMETCEVPSRGMTLRDLHGHRNIKQITIDHNGFIAENVMGRRFRLSPVTVYGIFTFHATII